MTSSLPNSVASSQSLPCFSLFSTFLPLTAHIENENTCMAHGDQRPGCLKLEVPSLISGFPGAGGIDTAVIHTALFPLAPYGQEDDHLELVLSLALTPVPQQLGTPLPRILGSCLPYLHLGGLY